MENKNSPESSSTFWRRHRRKIIGSILAVPALALTVNFLVDYESTRAGHTISSTIKQDLTRDFFNPSFINDQSNQFQKDIQPKIPQMFYDVAPKLEQEFADNIVEAVIDRLKQEYGIDLTQPDSTTTTIPKHQLAQGTINKQ